MNMRDKELNEALVSRFLVVDIPKLDKEKLMLILKGSFLRPMKKN